MKWKLQSWKKHALLHPTPNRIAGFWDDREDYTTNIFFKPGKLLQGFVNMLQSSFTVSDSIGDVENTHSNWSLTIDIFQGNG